MSVRNQSFFCGDGGGPCGDGGACVISWLNPCVLLDPHLDEVQGVLHGAERGCRLL